MGAINWWYTDAGFGGSSGEEMTWYTADEGASWTARGARYGFGFAVYDDYTFTPPTGRPTTKRLVAAAASAIWYEDV